MEMAEKLWDLANVITGFSVLQSLAMIFALGKGDFNDSLRSRSDHLLAFGTSLFFGVLYVLAIYWCGNSGKISADKGDQSIWSFVTWGRCTTVVLFNLIMWGTRCSGTTVVNSRGWGARSSKSDRRPSVRRLGKRRDAGRVAGCLGSVVPSGSAVRSAA